MRKLCLENPHRLTERELAFVESLGRWRGPLTNKQLAWLERITNRL
jgi:hypothetical protein